MQVATNQLQINETKQRIVYHTTVPVANQTISTYKSPYHANISTFLRHESRKLTE